MNIEGYIVLSQVDPKKAAPQGKVSLVFYAQQINTYLILKIVQAYSLS